MLNAENFIQTLAFWVRAEADTDLSVFRTISEETIGLPIGLERQYWSEEALRREDLKIQALEERWKPAALAAAYRLVERYSWTLAARQRRRKSSHAD